MPDVKKKPQVRRREDMREKIINASALTFAEKGFSDSTIQDIARELGITGAAIYYYFDSKDHLLFEIWKRAGNKLQVGIDAVRLEEDCSPLEKLRNVFRRHLEIIISDKPIFEVLILQRSRLPEVGRDELIADERRYENSIVQLITELPDQQLRLDEPRILAMGILAQLNGVIRWFSKKHRLSLVQIADFYFDLFASGALVMTDDEMK